MSETMHIQNLFTRIATLKIKQYTIVKYTQASGLPDWKGAIEGTLTNSSIPNKQNIETVDIGESVTNIGNMAFYTCTNLTSVTIPDSVTNFGFSAFSGCSSLTSVTIPNSVTSIGQGAFYECQKLYGEITIPDEQTTIGDGTFYNCQKITKITFGSSVTNINRFAFYQCYNCTIFDFRKATSVPSLTDIHTFERTPSNKEIIVPDSLYDQWIAASNWNSDTNNIRPCIVKASQSSLGVLNPTKVRYTQASGLPDAEFSIVGTLTGSNDEPHYTSQIPNVQNVESIQIGTDVTSLELGAFYDCTQLTSITIPNSITSIGFAAFNGCSGLTSVTIPNNVTDIGDYAFWGCSGLTSVTIPNSVTNIGREAFCMCSGLTNVTIGSGVTSLGVQLFYGCSNCTIFDFRQSISVPSLTDIYTFYNTPSNKEIVVPDSLYDSWRAASIWSSSTDNIVNCIVKASQSSLGPLT